MIHSRKFWSWDRGCISNLTLNGQKRKDTLNVSACFKHVDDIWERSQKHVQLIIKLSPPFVFLQILKVDHMFYIYIFTLGSFQLYPLLFLLILMGYSWLLSSILLEKGQFLFLNIQKSANLKKNTKIKLNFFRKIKTIQKNKL